MTITATVTIPEIVWTLFGVVALIANVSTLSYALGDSRYLTANGLDGIRRTIVNGMIYDESAACIKDAAVIVIGLVSMSVPSRADTDYAWVALVVAVALLVVVLMNMLGAVARMQARRRLYDLVRNQRRRAADGEAT